MTTRYISRRRLVLTVAGAAAIAVALVAPALGVLGGTKGAPTIRPSEARKVGIAVRADGKSVALYEAAATSRGRCVVVHVGSVDSPGVGNGGAVCHRGGTRQQTPIAAFVTWALEGERYAVTVAGRVTPRIQRLELAGGGAGEALTLRDGYFVTTLPDVRASGLVSDADTRQVLVGYDAAGHHVASLDLQELVDRASPAE